MTMVVVHEDSFVQECPKMRSGQGMSSLLTSVIDEIENSNQVKRALVN